MLLSSSFVLLLSSLVTLVYAIPHLNSRDTDAPYSVNSTTLAASITCPRGIHGAAGGVVLLVHGTGVTANESWSGSPYDVYLPYASPGFDVCWISLPEIALGDAQISAEYVAYNIPILAGESTTGQIAIIGHSQGGGLTIQWALDFWPSTRKYVSDYIALAGDFLGTTSGMDACETQNLAAGGCRYAVLQQTAGSKYLTAQNMRGGSALVNTTSIYTEYDDVIAPETGSNPTSVLAGATNIALQDPAICGPLHYAEHFTMLVDPAAYYLVYDALTHPGPASPTRFDSLYCDYFTNSTLLSYSPSVVEKIVASNIRLDTNIGPPRPRATVEPSLKPYVCEQGQATVCGSS